MRLNIYTLEGVTPSSHTLQTNHGDDLILFKTSNEANPTQLILTCLVNVEWTIK